MAKTKTADFQLNLLEARTSTAPCVPLLRDAVKQWRETGYKGVTDTTRILLNHWFASDHRIKGRKFEYHRCQREAIETLIFLYEVKQIRRQKDLLETYSGRDDLKLLQYDTFPRYCVKMATGSGKTKVMALALIWQYFNAVCESKENYASTFLLLAPNVIVYERLRTDFINGRIFREDPMIPPSLEAFWDFDCYLRGEPERYNSMGALYVSNIQQFYEAGNTRSGDSEPDALTGVLGSAPPAKKTEIEDFIPRIQARSGHCIVLNDEAHHTHDEESEWNKVIRRLHNTLDPCGVMQLDVTATPRHTKGSLFSWTVYDYPLKQAILDNLVKRPIKGIAKGLQEKPSDHASVRYQAYLVAGVERWKEYREQLAPVKKKPLLFLMMNDTTEADDVADFLRTKYPAEFADDKMLVIHTNNTGEIVKKDLDAARELARKVDNDDCPVNCIVSVLMLREGWDVQNVTVIVGLRPYTSKANILPEQTIGRGLRLMFRNEGTTYTERVDIIGNPTFIEFVEALEKDEELELGTFEVGKDKLEITTIQPVPEKSAVDIILPDLTPMLVRKRTLEEEIKALTIKLTPEKILPIKKTDYATQTFRYEGKDIITLQTLIEREYTIPEPQTSGEVISYYAKRIAEKVKLPSQFSLIAPKVKDFLQNVAFGKTVDLDDPVLIKAIASNVAHYVTVSEFASALSGIVIEQQIPELKGEGRALSLTPPYPFSKETFESERTVFNLVAADNDFERRFAKFLATAEDVKAFAKLPRRFAFTIDYTDNSGNFRHYEPDFVALVETGVYWIIETKGMEDIHVAHKDRAARLWCENATRLTGQNWAFVKVPQKGFEELNPTEFCDLSVFTLPALSLDLD